MTHVYYQFPLSPVKYNVDLVFMEERNKQWTTLLYLTQPIL